MEHNVKIEIPDFRKNELPFILNKYISSSFSEFYTNWHAEIEINYTVDGSETIYIDNDLYITQPGDILVINSGRIHTGSNTNWIHHCIIPSIEFLQSLGIESTTCSIEPLIRDEKMRNLLLDIISESEEDGPYQRALTIVAAQNFFLNLYKNYSVSLLKQSKVLKNSSDFSITVQVINYLRMHFSSDFPIDEIAKEIGITTSYMCRCVKRATGLSILYHLNTIRCRAAYHYLSHSNMKIYEIASRCGFSGSSYFAKTFRRIIGISPSEVPKEWL